MLAGLASAPAWAGTVSAPASDQSPFGQCDAAITAATKAASREPDKLLPAIARVESGRLDPSTGRVRPWPWTINVEGTGHYYDSKAEVIAAVQAFQAKGVRSIDVGCMQVNLMHHPKAFSDLDEAFDPAANARYAVRFLSSLFQQAKDWHLATAWYHSMAPDRGEEYQRLVFGRVMAPMGGSGGMTGGAAVAGFGQAKPTGPYGVWPPPGERYAAIPPLNFAFAAIPHALQPKAATFTGAQPVQPKMASFGGITVLPVRSLAPLSPNQPFGAKR